MAKNFSHFGALVAGWLLSSISTSANAEISSTTIKCGRFTGISHYAGPTLDKEGMFFDGQGAVTLVFDPTGGPDVYVNTIDGPVSKSSTGAKVDISVLNEKLMFFSVVLNNGDTEKYVLFGDEKHLKVVATFHYLNSAAFPPRVSLFTADCS